MGLEYKNFDDFMNVYLHYQCHVNFDIYVEYIEKISANLEDCTTSKLAVIGDFNAAVSTTFETELIAMCNDQCLVVSDYEVFNGLSQQFTYDSDDHSTTSWLDHFICSYDLHVSIFDMQILDKRPNF